MTSEYFKKGKSKCKLFFYWPILKESWNPAFIWPIGEGFTTYFRCNYRRDRPLNEENKPRLLAVSAIQCRYLITPLDVIGAEWVNAVNQQKPILKSSLTREGLQPDIYHTWDRVLIITLSLIGAPTHDLSHLRRVLIITLSLSGAPTHDLSHLRRFTSPMLFSNSIRSTHKSTYLGLKQFYFLVLQRNWQFWDSPQ